MLTTDLLSQSSSKFKTEADGVPATALNAFSSSDPSFTSMHCVPQNPHGYIWTSKFKVP